MERGREGRRGGGGGGLVHAPRRPRTGFKDAAVGDDADDMMDEVHNSRLRERAKKDGGGVSGGPAVATSIVGPSSRNKRKRQGSQEMQVHARNSPVDEVEETTEDTEMGVSEDDDDPPPPIIPRRPGKPRPPAKFAEDGVAVDPPAVPRKARTAMGKRQQDTAPASVAESPAHVVIAVAAPMPLPLSTPSSSSIASLKPGRRTKPSGSKSRSHKLAKVSTPSLVSEQEVEVAEALFDLARMFTQPPPSGSAVGSKAEAKAAANEAKAEAKHETKVCGSNLPPQAPNGPTMVPSGSSVGGASLVAVGGNVSIRSKSPGVASGVPPAPSPSVTAAAPAADGAKRKRPKARNRTEEGGAIQSRTGPSPATAGGSGVGPVKDADQSTSRASTADRSAVKVEGGGTATVGVVTGANNVAVTASSAPVLGGASSGMSGLGGGAASAQGGAVDGAVDRAEKNSAEKKGVHPEKKVGSGGGKAEGASSNSGEKRVAGSPAREKKAASGEAAGAALAANGNGNAESEAAAITSAGVGAAATKTEVDKRFPQTTAGPSDMDRVAKRDIDLMAVPSKAGCVPCVEKDGEGGERNVGEVTEKRLVDASAVVEGEDSGKPERECEREEKERAETERGRERERERELERERAERERRREVESTREAAKEAAKEREMEKERERERERAELSKTGLAVQRTGKSAKAENGRAQKGAERAGLGAAIGAPTMLGSAGPGPNGASVGGNIAVLPMSVGMLSWPAGMAGGLGYFPAAAAAVAAAEDSSPAVQVAPFMVGARGTTWKRCAQHVYIARFIDMQQQLNRHHQSYFTGGSQTFPKSYNLNVPLGPSESLFGGSGGSGVVGATSGATATGSTGGGGPGAANLEAERGLNAAMVAAAAAAGMQGAKERAAYGIDMVSRKSPGQHQGNGQGAPALTLQTGAMFGFPNGGSGSPSGASGGASGGMGGTNLNLPPGPGSGPGAAMSAGGGSSSALVPRAGGPVGGSASGGSGGVAASAAVQQAHYMQAMMQQAQSGSFPFAQFPPHFGAAAFSGPAAHMGAQQAAAQFFAPGGYYAHHLVAQSQQQGGQQSGGAGPVSKTAQQQGGSRGLGGEERWQGSQVRIRRCRVRRGGRERGRGRRWERTGRRGRASTRWRGEVRGLGAAGRLRCRARQEGCRCTAEAG